MFLICEQLENHPLDRKTFIVRQEEDYVINRVITQGEDVQRSTQTVKTDTIFGFVSEGLMSFVLFQAMS